MTKRFALFLALVLAVLCLPSFAAAQASEPGILAVIFGVLLIFILVFFLYLTFDIFMIIDCVKRPFKQRFIWMMLLGLMPFAAIFYYFIIKRKNDTDKSLINERVNQNAYLACAFGFASILIFTMSFIFTPLAIAFYNMHKKNAGKKAGGHDIAKAGLILGIVALVLLFMFLIVYFGFFLLIFYMSASNDNGIQSGPSQYADFQEGLKVQKLIVGTDNGLRSCLEADDYNFTIGQSQLCFLPMVEELQKDEEGYIWFDMDFEIRDSDGNLVWIDQNMFEDEGYRTSDKEVLDDFWITYSPGGDDTPGSGVYTYTVTVYDVFAEKKATLSGNLTMEYPENTYETIYLEKGDNVKISGVDVTLIAFGDGKATLEISGKNVTMELKQSITKEKFDLTLSRVTSDSVALMIAWPN